MMLTIVVNAVNVVIMVIAVIVVNVVIVQLHKQSSVGNTLSMARRTNKLICTEGWGLFYGTERNGTERNDGLNHGTERFLKLKLATYHC